MSLTSQKKVILGLGNIGNEYINTRHNVGFMVIDKIAKNLDITCDIKEKKFYYARGLYKNKEVYLVKPTTYMNLSGVAVNEIIKKTHIEFSDLLIIYDDVDLSLGNIRVRNKGGSAGHNGIKSIFDYIGSDFARLRVGIGGREKGRLRDHVLDKFKKSEAKLLDEVLETSAQAALDFCVKDMLFLMNRYNKKNAEKEE